MTIDDFDGGRQVGEYLKEMGHCKVLCISDNDICMDRDRYNGLNNGLGKTADFLLIPMSKKKRDVFYQKNLSYTYAYFCVSK